MYDADPRVVSMLQKVIDATRRQGKLLAVFTTNPDEVESLASQGINMIIYGHDARIISRLYRQSLARMRDGAAAGVEKLAGH
jgi:2-keto-3-deoxy-L-rhamnonate aldolase RhmA